MCLSTLTLERPCVVPLTLRALSPVGASITRFLEYVQRARISNSSVNSAAARAVANGHASAAPTSLSEISAPGHAAETSERCRQRRWRGRRGGGRGRRGGGAAGRLWRRGFGARSGREGDFDRERGEGVEQQLGDNGVDGGAGRGLAASPTVLDGVAQACVFRGSRCRGRGWSRMLIGFGSVRQTNPTAGGQRCARTGNTRLQVILLPG